MNPGLPGMEGRPGEGMQDVLVMKADIPGRPWDRLNAGKARIFQPEPRVFEDRTSGVRACSS